MTHSDLTDTFLRSLLANELMVLRRSMKQACTPIDDSFFYGIRTGLDTMARRMEMIQTAGLKAMYTTPQGVTVRETKGIA